MKQSDNQNRTSPTANEAKCQHCTSNVTQINTANFIAEPIYPYVSEHYGIYHHLPVIDATIGNWNGKVLLDTGATRSIISQEIVERIGVVPKENINYVAQV